MTADTVRWDNFFTLFITYDENMADKLTVRDLVLDPSLDTKVLAGHSGLDREVKWAQTSEAVDPWRWLGEAELLMTLGMNMPSDPEEQRAFIDKIHQAGIAAMAVGADGLAPPLSRQMLEQADRLGLPVLFTGVQIPFVVIARTVAAASANPSRSLLSLSRLYQVAAEQDPGARKSGAWVYDLFGFNITVVDTATGCVVIGADILTPSKARLHSLSTIRPTQLHVAQHAQVDSLTLVHLMQILAVDANAILQQSMTAIAEGEAAFRALRNRNESGRSAAQDQSLLDSGSYRIVASDEKHHERVVLGLALWNIRPVATTVNGTTLVALGSGDLELAEKIYSSTGVIAGLSAEHLDLGDLGGAASESVDALRQGQRQHGSWTEFHGERVSLLARSRSEAEDIINTVLGPLCTEEHSTQVLRESLFALLDSDMQWQQTASDLGIHRQTLAYRIRRVEQLTGRQLKRVPDLTELWLARQAWELTAGAPA